MTRQFLKKEGVALVSLARYLLAEQPGNRLRTIDELSAQFSLSVGVVQNALKVLENHGHVTLERRGRNGTTIVQTDYQGLFAQADIGNVVCAMPLPYTKLYEGLASGLKAQFAPVPLYFAHMRGADIRIQCLLDGIYSLAVVSRLAAESYLQQGVVEIALALGENSYVKSHQLICRQYEQEQIRRVGLDANSPDQRLLTDLYFNDRPIERVNLSYHEGLEQIKQGKIDGMIWNVTDALAATNLITIPLNSDERCRQASEAVILIDKRNHYLQALLHKLVDINKLLMHQQAVDYGEVIPSY